ncbi:MAG: hypothetical protein H0W15_05375 [Gemmatimonadales bacterium]|nr:hypothetical protein [Gemmatimonadales bacterium]
MSLRSPGWLVLAGMVAACSTTTPTDPGPVADTYTASIVAGQGQFGLPSTALAVELKIRVVLNGTTPAANRTVTWAVATGGGTIVPASTTTNTAGEATARWTLGAALAQQTVTVNSTGVANQLVFNATAQATPAVSPTLVATVPIPANYGIHDTFVRDGLAFVMAWNNGIRIYDVGNGISGGSPASPQLVSSLVTNVNGVPGGPQAHNAWWFHNPVTQQKRYLFVGQEGPANIGTTSSGDIHIVDVSNLAAPVEVGFIHVPGAGAHNFWMDEARQVLYAAFYNGGVAAIDVSGTLSGDMSSRIIARVQPGGNSTYVWGVMQLGNTLYASDMLSGFWALDALTLATKGGGFNVDERFTSDLWAVGNWAYSGTWGTRSGTRGNAIKIWSLSATGVPTLSGQIVVDNVGTVSDVAVTADGKALVATAENLASPGLLVYDRVDPANPSLRGRVIVPEGLHTGELAVINGRSYVFAARNPGGAGPALVIYDITGVVP